MLRTNPPSSRPFWWDFRLVRLHKVRRQVFYSHDILTFYSWPIVILNSRSTQQSGCILNKKKFYLIRRARAVAAQLSRPGNRGYCRLWVKRLECRRTCCGACWAARSGRWVRWSPPGDVCVDWPRTTRVGRWAVRCLCAASRAPVPVVELPRPAAHNTTTTTVTVVYQVVGYYVTRECASCGILWCRRTPRCPRRTNRSVSGRVQL